MNKKIFIAIVSLLGLTLASCTQETNVSPLSLSINAYTFSGRGDSIVVSVSSESRWDVETEDSWITTSDKRDNSIVIGVMRNDTEGARKGSVRFYTEDESIDFSVEQQKISFVGSFKYMADYIDRVAISPNGKYVAGMYQQIQPDDSYIYTLAYVDTETGEEILLEPITGMYGLEPSAIASDASIIIFTEQSTQSYIYDIETDDIVEVVAPAGLDNPVVEQISNNNEWVGWAYDFSAAMYVPVKWTNGEPETLEMPETNVAGDPISNGAMARGISPDGSVIYGSEWDTYGMIYWKDGRMFYPGLDMGKAEQYTYSDGSGTYTGLFISTVVKTAERYSVSDNGEWIAATYWEYTQSYEGSMPVRQGYPVRINTVTNQVEILKDFPNCAGMTVDSDGTLFGGSPYTAAMSHYVFDLENKTTIPQTDYILSKYGYNKPSSYYVEAIRNGVLFGEVPVYMGYGTVYLYWYYNAGL